jgi:hypothetical protein
MKGVRVNNLSSDNPTFNDQTLTPASGGGGITGTVTFSGITGLDRLRLGNGLTVDSDDEIITWSNRSGWVQDPRGFWSFTVDYYIPADHIDPLLVNVKFVGAVDQEADRPDFRILLKQNKQVEAYLNREASALDQQEQDIRPGDVASTGITTLQFICIRGTGI